MSNEVKKFAGIEALSIFLQNCRNIFATKNQGAKADTAVQSVKIGSVEYKEGTSVILPEYPVCINATISETKPTNDTVQGSLWFVLK